jgi:hypothetical protein
MPRKVRVEYPSALYHITSRGDRREYIFLDDVDRQDFLKTLAESCQKTGLQMHTYCLMSIQQDTALARREFELRMESRRAEESDEESLQSAAAGRLGSPEFKARMLRGMEGKLGEPHAGEMRLETGNQGRADCAGGTGPVGQLQLRRKNDPQKLAMASAVACPPRGGGQVPLTQIRAHLRSSLNTRSADILVRFLVLQPQESKGGGCLPQRTQRTQRRASSM